MPSRRVSAGHNIASSSRVHRSNGSNHSISAQSPILPSSNLPYSTNAPPSPQSKVVQVLINRLKNKLPCNSGTPLTELEADEAVQQTVDALVDLSRDSLDMISLALTEQLERLAKQIEGAGYRGVDILQSQLFLLKVLALAMASRWGSHVEDTRPSSRTSKPTPGSKPTTPDTSVPMSGRGRHPSSEQLSMTATSTTRVSVATPTLLEPPALDDNCAKYIVSVMVLLLRQASPRRTRLTSATNLNFDTSYQDLELADSGEYSASDEATMLPPPIVPGMPRAMNRAKHPSSVSLNSGGGKTSSLSSRFPQHSVAYERTSFLVAKSVFSLHCAIAKYTGRIVYHLSASNWTVVLGRIRQRIHGLASTTDPDPDTADLQLLTHSALDRSKLVQSLQELSSLLMNLKKDAQVPVAIALRTAVWNWIELCDDEFNDALRSHRRLDGAPERVFDLLYDLQESSKDKSGSWPTLAVLLCISGDRMKGEYEANLQRGAYRKERNITDLILKNLPFGSRYFDVAFVCAVDVCRAASRVRLRPDSENEVPLISLANDVAHDLKMALYKWTKDKPFWECPDEIDVCLMSDALVALYRFLPEEESLPIFQQSVEPERSDAVKLSVLRACLTLICDGWKLPWQRPLEALKTRLMKRLNSMFIAAYSHRGEIDKGIARKSSLRPKAKRFTSEILPERELLVLEMLTIWRADIGWYIDLDQSLPAGGYFNLCVSTFIMPTDPAITWSLGRTARFFMEFVLTCPKDHPKREGMSLWVSEAMPAALAAMSHRLLNTRTDLQTQRMLIYYTYELMYRYVHRYSTNMAAGDLPDPSVRSSAFALAEIAFLVCLCSADGIVSLTACNCLRLLAQAERQPHTSQPPESIEDEVLKRHPVYEQLGDPKVSMIGRVGHQKRIRKLMRLITMPSAIHVAVWQELYFRWCALTEATVRYEVVDNGPDRTPLPVGDLSLTVEERQAQWQNTTLFLASLGAACTREQHDPYALTKFITPNIIPDSCRVLREPSELLSNFLTETVNLLVNDLPQIRDVARESLSNEASNRLYGKIVKRLDDVVRQVADDETMNYSVLFMFLDHFIGILKVLSENVTSLSEDMRVVDVPSLLYTVATFISRIDGSDPTSGRLKHKFCVLCKTVFGRTEPVMMRIKESGMRQSIIDLIIDWVQETPTDDPQASVVQHDLNVAVFRTAVTLFDRLQLEPSDGATGEDAAHAVSRLFIRYASFLIKTWESLRCDGNVRSQQREGELRELLIDGLAALVSANKECGVKHCLTLSYEPESTKRLIFTHVFIRVLNEGIKFAPYEETPILIKHSPLCELVKGPDMALALAICEVCPPNEVDAMNGVLLNLFDTRSSLMSLLKTMIDLEIGKTESDTALFRSNSTCTRFLSAFAKVYGYNYLRSLIAPLVKLVTTMPPGHGYELDPARVSREELAQNKETVEFITGKFLEIISSSVPALPSIIREICAHIAKAVNEVWPEAKFAALGAFIFLRFISPAIVTPETVDVEIPNKDMTIRRGLMVIAKIIQNLANNILFGKEAHMVILNDFLKDNIVTVTKFLSEINKYAPPGPDEEADEWLERTYDDTDTILLHRFFERHADKIGKELLSSSKVVAEKMTPEAEAAAANGKRAWDALCATLVELGQPLESPRLSKLTSREHRDYLDLMSRCDRRDTTDVQGLFVEAITPPESNAVFVLSVSKINIEILDLELLLYYVFKRITSSTHENRDFEIICDCTTFSSTSQVPAQWLKFAMETIPDDIWQRFQALRLLTPNSFALRYLRRLYNNLTSGGAEILQISIHTSVGELLRQYPDGLTATTLGYAVGLEAESSDEFQDVTMRHGHPMRVPVCMQVAQSHIRITTTKAITVSNSLSSKATEIIPLSDINDVYHVSTGHDSHEFIIRKIKQGVTMYFSSPYRDPIVKAIRAAKGLMMPAHLPSVGRHDRLTNIITTLLRIALVGITTEDETRTASFSLLSAICTYLDFEGRPAVPSKGVVATGHPGPFLVMVSEGLSSHIPHLTMDFISEMAGSIPKMSVPMRANCLQYLGPWIKNLALFTDSCSKFYDPTGTRFRDCIRMLVDVTTSETQLHNFVQKFIWAEVGKLDTITVNTILEELMRAAVDGGMGSTRCEKIADTMSAINTINVRGRVLARVRKVIGKTSIKPTKTLAENVHWNEIACLARLLLVIGNSPRNTVQSQLFVPEIMHLVTLIAATGELYVRCTVYAIVTHMLHAMYSLRLTDATVSPEVEDMLDECCRPEGLKLFGLSKPTPTSDYVIYDPPTGKALIDDLEALNRLLLRIMQTISGTQGLLNVWHARWMSLITSTAFQLSPAVQSRAFVSLGILANADVDDDLLYQMLVAFKTALSQASENDTTSVVSMLRCITNVIPATSGNSRYATQLFWLAVALLQSSHMALYVEAIRLLRVSVENMYEHGHFKERGVPATLLEGRVALEDVTYQLDHLLGLSFDSSFSFALAATVFKGIRHSALRDATEGALRSILRITVRSCVEVEHANDGPGAPICQDILGYVLALIPMSTRVRSYKRLLKEANADASWLAEDALWSTDDEDSVYKLPYGLIGYGDSNTALLVTSFITAMLVSAQGDDTESAILYNILSDVADACPEVIGVAYESLQDRIKETFANSNSPVILSAISNVFRIATQDMERVAPPSSRALAGAGSASTLSTVDEGMVHGPGRRHLSALEEQGMQGLVNSFQFLPLNRGQATKVIQWISELVMLMIE